MLRSTDDEVIVKIGADLRPFSREAASLQRNYLAVHRDLRREDRQTTRTFVASSQARKKSLRDYGKTALDVIKRIDRAEKQAASLGLDSVSVLKGTKNLVKAGKAGSGVGRAAFGSARKALRAGGPVGNGIATGLDIAFLTSDIVSLFRSNEKPSDSSDELKSLLAELKAEFLESELAARDAATATGQLEQRHGEAVGRIQQILIQLKELERGEAIDTVSNTIAGLSAQLGDFDVQDLEPLNELLERRKELVVAQRSLETQLPDNFIAFRQVEEAIKSFGDLNATITTTSELLGLTRKQSRGFLKVLGSANSASSLDDRAKKLEELAEVLRILRKEGQELTPLASEFSKTLLNSELITKKLENTNNRLAGGIESSVGPANSLANELERAASNAARVTVAGVVELDRAKLENKFVNDPAGLAGALQAVEFDATSGKNIGQQDRQVKAQLQKEREAQIRLASELAAIQEETRRKREAALRQQTLPTPVKTQSKPSLSPQVVQTETTAVNEQGDAISRTTTLLNDYELVAERARIQQELLTAAHKSGVEITPELRMKIEQLAMAYTAATAGASELAQSQNSLQEVASEFNSIARNALGGFIDDLRNGTSAADALENALRRIEDRLINIALDAIFPSNGGGLFGGLLGGATGGLFGFKNGGQVRGFATGGLVAGPGSGRSDSIPALLSNGEFVATARATKDNRPLLEAINAGSFNLKRINKFADGGIVSAEQFNQRLSGLNTRLVPSARAGASERPVMVEPQVNLRNINAFDADEVVTQVLSGPAGEKAMLNMVRARPAAFRGALGV